MAKLRLTPTDYVAALGMFVYAASVAATPIILIEIAGELRFNLAEGGGIEAVRTTILLGILVASGAAARRFGLRPTLGLGGIVLGVGLAIYAIAPSYAVILAAIVLVGLGSGVLEALLNPLVQHAHPEDSARYLNVVNAFFSAGVLASVLLVGDLLTRGVSWRVLVGAIGVIAFATGLLFLVLRHEKGTTEQLTQSGGVWDDSRRIAREGDFWLFAVAMFCAGGAEGAFTFWSASYIQLHFDTLARAGAIGTALFAGGMVVGRFASGRFVRQEGVRRLIIGSALVGIIASTAAWAVESVVAFYLVVFAAGLTIACFWPSIQSYAASVMDVDATTLFILLSCFGIPGFGLTSWIMGLIAEGYGLRGSLLVIPGLLAVLVIVMVSSRLKPLQRANAELK